MCAGATQFSAALCRGLIEAVVTKERIARRIRVFSAALCRGLIEALPRSRSARRSPSVFRGFMPRPH